MQVLGQFWVVCAQDLLKDLGVDAQLTQGRGVVFLHVLVQGRNQEPERILDRHVHQHHADKPAHPLAVPDAWVILCIGAQDRVQVLLAGPTHPVPEMDMIRVAPVDVTLDHIKDGLDRRAGQELGKEARLAERVGPGKELPHPTSDRGGDALSNHFFEL